MEQQAAFLPTGPACKKKEYVIRTGRRIYNGLEAFLEAMKTEDERTSELLRLGIQVFGSAEELRTAIRMEKMRDEMRLIYLMVYQEGTRDVALTRLADIIQGRTKF